MFEIENFNDPTVYAIPLFILLIVVEFIIDIRRKLKLYEIKDSVACITMGLGSLGIGIFTKAFMFFLYMYLYQFRIFDIPNVWWMWVLLLFADDFSFYWKHRLSHEVRILWAGHVQHHSSEKMNFSVALRQSWGEPFFEFIFWIWLPIIGFHPINILVMMGISLIFQFLLHTKLVGRLGFLEYIFNTPSHHRVHHATQVKYLDRNHAGIFIIWDRLFGTFSEEEEDPVYGITTNIHTFNPLKIATHEYVSLWKDVRRAKKFSDKLKYIFYPPGWSHDGEICTSNRLREELSKE